MNYIKLYADFLGKSLKLSKKMKVVFDCSNGTTGPVIKQLGDLANRNLESILINDQIDGNFPAHGPNPMNEGAMDDLSAAVLEHKADLGVIFDGDGDRVFFVDNKGRSLPADVVIALIAQNYQGSVVVDLRVGYLPRELLAKAGRNIIDSRVGHFFMKQVMAEHGIAFGGELSGHYYFHFPGYYADSGIFAAIELINTVARLESDLTGWVDKLPVYYRSGEVNFEVKDKAGAIKRVTEYYQSQAKRVSRLDGVKMIFDGFWFNVRPSNTEDLLRLNLEAKDKRVFRRELAKIKSLLK